ncbi:MAG: adenylate kinase [Actinomycetota bacterium]
MRLVIFGPQGAGKGTQAARLAEKHDIPSIATGDIFRWAIRGGTALGLKAKEYVDRGRFVPDDITIGVVVERLSADDARAGFILDGFPRNLHQAKALDEFLDEKGSALDAALVIEVPEELSVQRLLGRRVCSNCGRNYNVDSPPQNDWVCDVCGGKVEARDDDTEETIRDRLAAYHEQTEPLKAYYVKKGILREIHGNGAPDEVFDRIVSAI